MKKYAELFATFFYVGKIRFAPGSWASLVSVILYAASFLFILINRVELNNLPNDAYVMLKAYLFMWIITVIITIFGIKVSTLHAQSLRVSDPGEIVIDEVAGQFICLLISTPVYLMIENHERFFSIKYLLVNFIMFRLFDIVKPWPIKWIDKNVKGGLGIMLDDVAAGIIAGLFSYPVILFFNQ